LARAPAWLRWIVRRKRAHWAKSVYLITSVEPGAGADGSDALIAVNITRLEVEDGAAEEEEEAAKPPEAEGLSTSSSSSSSSSYDEEEAEEEEQDTAAGEADSEPAGGGGVPASVQGQEQEQGPGQGRGRGQRQGRQGGRQPRVMNIPSGGTSSSSESEGPDGPIHSPQRADCATDEADEDNDEAADEADEDDDEEEEEEDEEENEEEGDDVDLDLGCSLVRTYVGGPLKPKKRLLVHLSDTLATSTDSVEVPLDREGGQEGGGRAYVYHQEDRDTVGLYKL
jgi:hypothetical protein